MSVVLVAALGGHAECVDAGGHEGNLGRCNFSVTDIWQWLCQPLDNVWTGRANIGYGSVNALIYREFFFVTGA
jgi:hypothetical protein